MANFIVDFTTVDRVQLNALLEIGVPFDDTVKGAEEALILYPSAKSRPSRQRAAVGLEGGTAHSWVGPSHFRNGSHGVDTIARPRPPGAWGMVEGARGRRGLVDHG